MDLSHHKHFLDLTDKEQHRRSATVSKTVSSPNTITLSSGLQSIVGPDPSENKMSTPNSSSRKKSKKENCKYRLHSHDF